MDFLNIFDRWKLIVPRRSAIWLKSSYWFSNRNKFDIPSLTDSKDRYLKYCFFQIKDTGIVSITDRVLKLTEIHRFEDLLTIIFIRMHCQLCSCFLKY